MVRNYRNLFLQQSYNDAMALYRDILSREKAGTSEYQLPVWDYVILSASNDIQALSYQQQIDARLKDGRLPSCTKYAVIPDPGGKRVGSGGATLNALRYIVNSGAADTREDNIAANSGAAATREDNIAADDLSKLKILIIHSGGDAKRSPQYSACGKVFSPIPHVLADGHRSTLFDEMMIAMCGIPARISAGMMVCSGDVLLLFNSLQLDFYEDGAAALSIKESVEVGQAHGVFLGSGNGYVRQFLHKQTTDRLRSVGATDAHDLINIDTGAVIFSGKMVKDLYSLADTDEKFEAMVNDHVRLSFYADFLYPLAEDSTLDRFYLEQPEGDFSPELDVARTKIWDVLGKYKMKLMKFSPASFLHFGTTREVLRLVTDEIGNYSVLGWQGRIGTNYGGSDFAVSNSYVSARATIGDGSYIEDSYIHHNAHIGKCCVISGLTVGKSANHETSESRQNDAAGSQTSQAESNADKMITIPDNTVLHGLKLTDGRFVVRMYGVCDNPKEAKWFGKTMDKPLWVKSLFPVRDSVEEALEATLAVGNKWLADRNNQNPEPDDICLSLKDSYNMADVTQILPWQEKLSDRIKVESLLKAIDEHTPANEASEIFRAGISKRVTGDLLARAERLDNTDLHDFGRKIRIYYYLSKITQKEHMEDFCFDTIRDTVLQSALNKTGYCSKYHIAKDEVVERLPVRVNWGGGWSDTPPYCMEHGGTVLNAAVTLDGILPIEVTIKKIPQNKIILTSTDIGSYEEFTDVGKLQDCHDPVDAFALHKAALIACGVIPYADKVSVDEICEHLGGGIYMNTRVINIPKGSGLGTSSILAGACVKGIYEFMGVPIADNDLYNRVMCMEQIMSTGGGWQDQVGGLAPGIKMVTADEALEQKIVSTPLRINEDAMRELNERYVIIYTGQRRLARNLLRDIVGKYIGNENDETEVLYRIQQLAVLMRLELEKGHIDGFAKLMNDHWNLSTKLDAGCTNTCIDQIFLVIEDLIDGKMICGAGGGGFIQVIMKKGVTTQQLQERLDEVFAESGVGVWKTDFCFGE